MDNDLFEKDVPYNTPVDDVLKDMDQSEILPMVMVSELDILKNQVKELTDQIDELDQKRFELACKVYRLHNNNLENISKVTKELFDFRKETEDNLRDLSVIMVIGAILIVTLMVMVIGIGKLYG